MVTAPLSWFERKFDFSFPPEIFPAVLERLRGTPARAEELVRSFPASVYTQRLGTKWSVQEHIGHLGELDGLHDGRIDDFLEGKAVLRPSDPQHRKTSDYNQGSMDTLLRNLRTGRQRMVYRLENIPIDVISRTAEHPRLRQKMRLVDMMYFIAEHDDHHLAHIIYCAYRILNR